MASEDRATRLKQKAAWESKLEKQTALLAGKGFDEKRIARDAVVKALKAKVKEANLRLKAIDANEKRTADLAAAKAERLAQPKVETPKAKAAAEPAPEAKAKKKKTKKEEGPVAQKV